MKSPKFSEHDRKKVISKIEEHFSIHLSPVGSRRKFLEDDEGKSYWVLGGYEDWHGIPPEMLEEEERRSTNGLLVIAKRYQNRIDVYSGALQSLIEHKEMLSHTKNGDYQFNINIRGNHLLIKEVPELVLSKLGETPYYENEKGADKKMEEIKTLIYKLSPEERAELLKKLANKLKT